MTSRRSRTLKGTSRRASPSGLSKLLVYLPVALQVIGLLRRSPEAQQARRGRAVRARKRDRALDFLLAHAERRLTGKTRKRGRRLF